MSVQETVEQKIVAGLDVLHLEVVNESNQHNVAPGSESHFKVTVVAGDFAGKGLVAQHRLVYDLLADELRGGIHALALHTYTEQAWRQTNPQAPDSPACLGGKARESVSH